MTDIRRRTVLLTALSAPFWGMQRSAQAGAQVYEELAHSVRNALHSAVADGGLIAGDFSSENEKGRWLQAMSNRLASRMADTQERLQFLTVMHYEAKRAGLDPQMVLGLIQVESNFRRYAVSRAGARGYMQVMPFWIDLIGSRTQNLFHPRTNLRYGCTILRHYLDIENGVLFNALGRYNGSLGKDEYPNAIRSAWYRNWLYYDQTASTE